MCPVIQPSFFTPLSSVIPRHLSGCATPTIQVVLSQIYFEVTNWKFTNHWKGVLYPGPPAVGRWHPFLAMGQWDNSVTWDSAVAQWIGRCGIANRSSTRAPRDSRLAPCLRSIAWRITQWLERLTQGWKVMRSWSWGHEVMVMRSWVLSVSIIFSHNS